MSHYNYHPEFFRQLGTKRLKLAFYVNNVHPNTLKKLIDPLVKKMPEEEKFLLVKRFQMEETSFDTDLKAKTIFKNIPQYSESSFVQIVARLAKLFLEKLESRKKLRKVKNKKFFATPELCETDSIGFSERTRLKIRASKIFFLSDLLTATDDELLQAYSFGIACLEEVHLFKKFYGF